MINFAENYTLISQENIRTIKHCRQSLLFYNNEPWNKKEHNSSFDVTMGSYDGTELCELIGIYIQALLESTLEKDLMGLYWHNGIIILSNTNSQQTEKIQKKIINIFKRIDFKIEITTNSTEVDFLDATFNLERNTYRPYKKPNDNLTYINTSSNHPPQIIKYLTQTISERLSRNSSSTEIFGQSRPDYKEALKKCGYKKQNCNTYNQICSKTTPKEEHEKSFGSTHLLV